MTVWKNSGGAAVHYVAWFDRCKCQVGSSVLHTEQDQAAIMKSKYSQQSTCDQIQSLVECIQWVT